MPEFILYSNFLSILIWHPEKAIEEIQELNNDYANGLARLRAHRNDLEAKTKQLDEMRAQFALYERDMDEIARNRFESNDNLLKIHKELVDQNAKLERAKRELKIGKKAMARHVQNRDYVRIFEVRGDFCGKNRGFSEETFF